MVDVPSREEHDALVAASTAVAMKQDQDHESITVLTERLASLEASVTALAAEYRSHVHESPNPDPDPGPDPDPDPQPVTARFPGDPGLGKTIYGASVEGGNTGLANFESTIGKTLALYRSYSGGGAGDAAGIAARAKSDIAKGRLPFISTKLPVTWAQFAAGAGDKWYNDILAGLRVLNGPVWLCLHHEPRGDGDPADWVDMQKRARSILDATAVKNVALVAVLNGYSFTATGAGRDCEKYRIDPGDGPHVMGFDSYNPWFPSGALPWREVPYVLSPALTITEEWGYEASAVGEHGCRNYPADPTRSPNWIRSAFEFAQANKIVGLSYFNSGANSPDGPWTLSGERLNAFESNLDQTAHPLPA